MEDVQYFKRGQEETRMDFRYGGTELERNIEGNERNGADTAREEMASAWEDEKWTWRYSSGEERRKTKVEVAGMCQRRNARGGAFGR